MARLPAGGLDAIDGDILGESFAAASQYPDHISLGSLSAADGLRLDGAGDNDEVGRIVCSLGDINGDGVNDLLITADVDQALGPYSAGAAYVVYGGRQPSGASLSLYALTPSQGFKITGSEAGEFLGQGSGGGGDFNGDGIADIILGAPGAGRGGTGQGGAYVLYGRDTDFAGSMTSADIAGTNGFRIIGGAKGDYLGQSVASAGDINGDGVDDIIIGAESADPHGDRSGSAYVLFGKAGGFAPTVDLDHLARADGFRIDGFELNAMLGTGLASAGDFNGDGIDDLLIGAPHANGLVSPGQAMMIFGARDGFPRVIEQGQLAPGEGFTMVGPGPGNGTGMSVAPLGDVNGDGRPDIAVGSFVFDSQAYVVFGHDGPFDPTLDLSALNGHDGFVVTPSSHDDQLGFPVARAGDVNGDGFDDIIVGSREADWGGHGSGSVYVIFGRASGFSPSINTASLDGSNGFRIDGAAAGDIMGEGASSAGDLNGDGLDDLIVGAWGADPAGWNSGSAYILYSRLPTTAVTRLGTVASQALVGGNLDDHLGGRGGDDRLWGHDGRDKLSGGDGADTLIGGGRDHLVGGEGADVFRFLALSDSDPKHPDHIVDLTAEDRIDLSAIDADVSLAGDQAFHLVQALDGGAGEAALAYHETGRFAGFTTLRADTDGDGRADLMILISGDHHDFSGFVL